MDINSASGYIDGASTTLVSVTGWLSGAIAWLFTFKNMVFFGILGVILWVTYFLYKQETMNNRYRLNRKREV